MYSIELRVKKKEYIDKDIKEWDAKQWTKEVNSKSSLQLYQAGKHHIKEDTTYESQTAKRGGFRRDLGRARVLRYLNSCMHLQNLRHASHNPGVHQRPSIICAPTNWGLGLGLE